MSEETPKEQALINFNLNGLAKPAQMLVDKFFCTVEGAFPSLIAKRAKAISDAKMLDARTEGDVAIIHALNKARLSEVEQRGILSLTHEAGVKQDNFEKIIKKTIPLLNGNAKPENINDDWLTLLKSKCGIVSDSEMQTIWARILAGEANVNKSFSRYTINLVSTLEKEDAHLFTSLCCFNWRVNNVITPLVFDFRDGIYMSHGLNFDTLTHLATLGLIVFKHAPDLVEDDLPENCIVSYGQKSYRIKFLDKWKLRGLHTGHVILTKSGKELSLIAGAQEVENINTSVLSHWQTQGSVLADYGNVEISPLIVESKS